LRSDRHESGAAMRVGCLWTPFGRAAAQVSTHGSVWAIAAGWLDRGELVEVEIDDGLQRLTGGAVA
jgi:hypothetical protein